MPGQDVLRISPAVEREAEVFVEPSRVVDFSYSEVVEGAKEFMETTARIEEYGSRVERRSLAPNLPTASTKNRTSYLEIP